MTASSDPAGRFLPPGFPLPEREAMARLRQSVLKETATPHPPQWAELAVLISADEAGIDLAAIDAHAVWHQPPESRAEVFALLGKLLAEYGG